MRVICRALLIATLLCVLAGTAAAQDEPTPYEIALARIAFVARTDLTVLNLQGLGLVELPSEIGQLTALQQLDIRNNKLAFLTPEIGQLIALEGFNLSGNRLTSLPPEIGQLTAMKLTGRFLVAKT
ncbi:MAG: hypothetical protein AAFR56_10810 [Chloroflexota bacterium]